MTTDHAVALSLEPRDEPHAAADARRRRAAPLSVRQNAAWMLAGNALYSACQWAMLMVLARLGTAAMVGQFVLALAVTTPVMAFFMLQLRSVQATDARGEYCFGDYLGLRLVTIVMAMATVAGICLASGYERGTTLIIVAAGASAGVDALSDVVYGLLQQRERMDRIAVSLVVRGAVALAVLATVTAATGSVFYGVLAIAAARVAVLVAYDLPNAALAVEAGGPAVWERGRNFRGLRPRCQVAKTLALAKLSLPLGVVMMLIGLSASIPRYFVEHYWGPHSLGIFGALGYLGLVGTTAVAAIGQSATPRLAQCYAAGQRKPFAWLLMQLMGLGVGLGLAGVVVAYLAGERLLGVFYGAEYARHNAILVWVMFAAGVGYVAAFGGYAITAARYFKVQIPLFACVVAATAGACWWLVPGYGMLGAAMSLLIASLVQLGGTAVVLAHAVRAHGGRVGPENP